MDFVNPLKVSSQVVNEALVKKCPVLRLKTLAREQVMQLSRVIPIQLPPEHPRRGMLSKGKLFK